MIYTQLKYGSNDLETIDQFETRKEARLMPIEYRLSGDGYYYLSGRACKHWRESK
jgi:hypothetical protein